MKKLITLLLLLVSAAAFSQKDTVMMNDRFITPDPNQLYEIKSLKLSTTYTIVSLSMAAAGTAFFIFSSHLYDMASKATTDELEKSYRESGDACMVWGVAMGVGTIAFNISSIVSMRQPTTIKPIKAL